MSWTRYLLSFEDRFNRAKYWMFGLMIFVGASILAGIVVAIVPFRGDANAAMMIIVIGALAWFTMMLIGSTVVGVKRLHDRDKSGWWLLVFYLVPSLAGGISQAGGAAGITAVEQGAGLIGAVIGIWGFIELGCLRGTVGPNRFGPDPLAPT